MASTSPSSRPGSNSNDEITFSTTPLQPGPLKTNQDPTATATLNPTDLTSTTPANSQLDNPVHPVHQLPPIGDDQEREKQEKLAIQITVESTNPSSSANEKTQASTGATKQLSRARRSLAFSFPILWPKVGTLHGTTATNDRPQWGIYWLSPTCMIVLTLIGIGSMVGHHLYNSKLHGHLVHDPQWPQRWGLALSTFGKMCLAGVVEIAYKQRVWVGSLSGRWNAIC